jgi:hypothetical protein
VNALGLPAIVWGQPLWLAGLALLPLWWLWARRHPAAPPVACWRRRQIEPPADRRLSQSKRVASCAEVEFRCAQSGSPQSRRMAQFNVGGNTGRLIIDAACLFRVHSATVPQVDWFLALSVVITSLP